MGNNLKISDLPLASRIDDDALVVLVQDHSNKVVTVSELSDKINERQNHTIDHLWHEMKRLTNADTVKALANSLANHEYRIDGIEKLNGKQDNQLISLTKAMQDLAIKSSKHEGDIRLLRTANVENRRSLAYLNCRVDALIDKSSSYFNAIDVLNQALKETQEKHEADLSYTYDYIKSSLDSAYAYAYDNATTVLNNAYAYTSYQVDNNWSYTYSAYSYINDELNTYLHRGGDEYWGVIRKYDDFFTGISDNYVPSESYTATTNACKSGCDC